MSAIDLLQLLAQITWVVLGVVAVGRVARRGRRTDRDIALFFGAIALQTIESRAISAFELPAEPVIQTAGTLVALALPYLLLRVVSDFTEVRAWVRRAAEAALVVSAALVIVVGTADRLVDLLLVAYFASVAIYSAGRSALFANASHGVTRRRMQAVAWGSYFLGVAVLFAGIGAVAPATAAVAGGLTQLSALASALSYAVGFAPPGPLRQFWQIPELRSFLARASIIPRSTMSEIVADLEAVAGRTLGARSTIGLWDEERGVLRFRDPHGAIPHEMGSGAFLGWRSFASQRPLYVPDVAAAHPEHAEAYHAAGVGPVLIAPISAGDRRLGVIEVFASREPIFAEDDLTFVQLIAQQAAVLLESRALLDEAARVRAQEEAARLKEDFVSAAAHDLKTPLTTIVAQAQLLERRAEREGRSAELAGVRRLVRETRQLSRLVEELLDASRIDRGSFPVEPASAELTDIARDVVARERAGSERVELAADGPAPGLFDRERIGQLIDNLIENALKYSPAESPVRVRVWAESGDARIAVTDRGIGIPPEDVPHVFERFRRGSNVDHRRFAGIGLGLYICRGIVDQHGGRIWVESVPGRETTFHVALPLAAAAAPPSVAPPTADIR